ncbi:MAG: zinc-binding dehydrogenase, partial [Gammaproteobacteria bacterium]|nr:zinc-binding dehydrogenase [Gammaproteobacteria bacterium]NIY32421.1 zinc-binding dehydrogenase [Gammaproteobacteria bacterium]
DGEGVDAVLDLVGGPYLAGSLACLSPRGRMIIVGLTAGRSSEIDLGTVLRKRLSIVGTSLRARPLEQKVAASQCFSGAVGSLLASGQVRPVIDRVYSLEEAAEAHRHMERNANFGKLVLTVG